MASKESFLVDTATALWLGERGSAQSPAELKQVLLVGKDRIAYPTEASQADLGAHQNRIVVQQPSPAGQAATNREANGGSNRIGK